jgi:hypothetical protein
MLIDILVHTPAWVWVLFAGLLALGLLQTRDRDVSRTRATVLPLVFVALSFTSVLRASNSGVEAFGAWLAGFAVILLFARSALAVHGARCSSETGSLHVPGSWVPMGLIVGLFLLRYGMGVLGAVASDLARTPAVSLGAQCAYGLFAGCFWVRSASLRRLAAPIGTRDSTAGAAL